MGAWWLAAIFIIRARSFQSMFSQRSRATSRSPRQLSRLLRRLMAHHMTSKYLWCGVLIAALSMVLALPARADKLQTDSEEIVIGIVAVALPWGGRDRSGAVTICDSR